MDQYFLGVRTLGPLLARYGFVREAEQLHPRSFGSGWMIVSDGSDRLRFGWDGKDRIYLLQLEVADGWDDLLGLDLKPDLKPDLKLDLKLDLGTGRSKAESFSHTEFMRELDRVSDLLFEWLQSREPRQPRGSDSRSAS